MDKNIKSLIESLGRLEETIESANINENGFNAHGWNHVALTKYDISAYISNCISKIKSYGDSDIPETLADCVEHYVDRIDLLNDTAKNYFNDNGQHLVYIVPVILNTLLVIFSDIEHELFSYENISDKNLLPKVLANRLRSTRHQLDELDDSIVDLKDKIALINDAHEAAESLPTDLASLRDARVELSGLITSSNNELKAARRDIISLKEEIVVLKNEAKVSTEELEQYSRKAELAALEASKLVEECDDALQITTTQGLAAGFDQKANELKKSIWVWILGLLVALGAGAWVGGERVDAFTEILKNDLTAGQAILHTIMSIFSIGGPLWLAWISTQQITQRFKLSEDYSYKATVAKSFTGFKKFAERFDPSTEERLFNSTLDRLDEMPLRLIEGKDYNSPWHEFVDSDSFKTAISMFPTLAIEAGKFASRAELRKKPTKLKPAKSYQSGPGKLDAETEDDNGVDSENVAEKATMSGEGKEITVTRKHKY